MSSLRLRLFAFPSKTRANVAGLLALLAFAASCGGSSDADSSGGGGSDSGGQGGSSSQSGGASGSGGASASGGGSSTVDVPIYVRRIVALGGTTCVIERGGEVFCWAGQGERRPLSGEFVELSANRHLCGVRTDGRVSCTGNSDAVPDHSDFEHVTAMGNSAGCGVRTGGQVECWGYSGFESPDRGDFDALASLEVRACGLKIGQPAVCWTLDIAPDDLEMPTSDRVSMYGYINWCQIVGGRVECARLSGVGFGSEQPSVAHQIAVGEEMVCYLTAEGARVCSGSERSLVNVPDASARFVELAVGDSHACGILQSGGVTCWGTLDLDGVEVEATAPSDLRVF